MRPPQALSSDSEGLCGLRLLVLALITIMSEKMDSRSEDHLADLGDPSAPARSPTQPGQGADTTKPQLCGRGSTIIAATSKRPAQSKQEQ
jgi:hypothetical protein